MREKEKHLQLYTDIVDVFENMDDDDDEAKKEIDANRVKVLMNQILAISGLLPAEVQAAQVSLCQVFLYKGLSIITIRVYSKTVVGQCVLAIPSIIAGSWFTSGQ